MNKTVREMENEISTERAEAIFAYTVFIKLSAQEKRKHLRLSKHYIQILQDNILPHWPQLNERERLVVMFILNERQELDTKYVGPPLQIIMDCFVRRFMTPDFAARFVLTQDSRLN